MIKTVVELDLVGYSTIGENFEQGLDVNKVAELNQQIQSFIDEGLKAVAASRAEHVMTTTGDGAILVFDSAAEAHRFAQAVHGATREHNRTRQQPLAKRVFRIGAASGEIVMQARPNGGFDIAGSTIARAVRLEAKAWPGGVLIDQETFRRLGPDGPELYGPQQMVPGKRDELFPAHAWRPYPEGAKDASFFTKQTDMCAHAACDCPAAEGSKYCSNYCEEAEHSHLLEIGCGCDCAEDPPVPASRGFGRNQRWLTLEYFKRLKSNQYYDLIFLLEIPITQRPAETLNLEQQKMQVLRWVEENGKLDLLLSELKQLTEPESAVHPS